MEARIDSYCLISNALIKLGKITPPVPTTIGTGQFGDNQIVRYAAAQMMAKLIAASLGLGLAGAGTVGLMRALRPRQLPTTPSPHVQRIEIAVPPDEDPGVITKHAKDSSSGATPVSWAGDQIYKYLLNMPETAFNKPGIVESIQGRDANSVLSVPAVWGIGAPAALLAGMGAWHGVDKLMASRRSQEHEDEIADAKAQYYDLVNSSFQKRSSEDVLDEIVGELEKQGTKGADSPDDSWIPAPVRRWGATAGGVGVGVAALVALLSGKLSYDYFQKRTDRALIEKAMQRRARQRSGGVPSIYVEPVSFPASEPV